MPRLRRRLTLVVTLTLPFVLASALTSCSQAQSPVVAPASVSASASASVPASASAPEVRRIDITVTGKQVTPPPAVVNIKVGESLTISITSDHDDQVHLHGFEIEKDLKAGTRLEITVKGAQTGVFDVELHHPALRILQVAVR